MESLKVSGIAVRTTIDSFEEILGTNGKNAVLKYAGLNQYVSEPPDYFEERTLDSIITAQLHSATHDLFGTNGVRALLYRAGRRLISVAIEKSRSIAELIEKSPGAVFKTALDALCYHSAQTGVHYTEYDDKIEVIIPECDVCVGVIETEPFCHFWKGMLEEIASFDTRYHYTVLEVKCKAMGDGACVFYLEKHRIREEL